MRRPTSLAVIALLTLALAGCTGEPVPGDTPTPDDPSPTPTATSTDPADDPGDLPGEPYDVGPEAGARLGVVGVEASDVLNLRSGPGVGSDVVAELAPLEADVIATGRSRIEGRAVWVEAEVDGVTGWANFRYLGYLADTDDVTYRISEASASSYEGAADRAIEQLYPDAGDLTVTVVDGPHEGVIGEVTSPGDITVDVLGFGDDSVLGVRLHVFATPDGGAITVRNVELTTICARGVDDGLCV